MPRAGTYKKSPKSKARWYVRPTADGFLVVNVTTGIPLCGYWGSEAIALKNGRLYFGTEPTTPEVTEGWTSTDAQTAQAGDGGDPAGRSEGATVDLPPPSARPERTVETVALSSGEVPVESGPVVMPEPAPVRAPLSPQEACDLICKVFRAKRIARPKQR